MEKMVLLLASCEVIYFFYVLFAIKKKCFSYSKTASLACRA